MSPSKSSKDFGANSRQARVKPTLRESIQTFSIQIDAPHTNGTVLFADTGEGKGPAVTTSREEQGLLPANESLLTRFGIKQD
jgi:hypothetical protein